jgi:hypothetical protein
MIPAIIALETEVPDAILNWPFCHNENTRVPTVTKSTGEPKFA